MASREMSVFSISIPRRRATKTLVQALLGGSWVDTSGAISRLTIAITHSRGLITTHEPPSSAMKP